MRQKIHETQQVDMVNKLVKDISKLNNKWDNLEEYTSTILDLNIFIQQNIGSKMPIFKYANKKDTVDHLAKVTSFTKTSIRNNIVKLSYDDYIVESPSKYFRVGNYNNWYTLPIESDLYMEYMLSAGLISVSEIIYGHIFKTASSDIYELLKIIQNGGHSDYPILKFVLPIMDISNNIVTYTSRKYEGYLDIARFQYELDNIERAKSIIESFTTVQEFDKSIRDIILSKKGK